MADTSYTGVRIPAPDGSSDDEREDMIGLAIDNGTCNSADLSWYFKRRLDRHERVLILMFQIFDRFVDCTSDQQRYGVLTNCGFDPFPHCDHRKDYNWGMQIARLLRMHLSNSDFFQGNGLKAPAGPMPGEEDFSNP